MGNAGASIPGRFRAGDHANAFWLPLHKLFDGDECLKNISGLKVVLAHTHLNEKLRRIHRAIHILGHASQHNEPDISQPPFVQADLVTGFVQHPNGGSALVIPRNAIVEEVKHDGKPVTVTVFPSLENTDASLRLFPRPRRWAPEFVHVRTRVGRGNRTENLNHKADVVGIVSRGGYEAAHYRDFTGDGWIQATCPQLSDEIPVSIAAYSIIAPPDLMPNLKQTDLTDWYERDAPEDIKNNLWAGTSPTPLCDHRVAANLELPGGVFQTNDTTVTALVGMLQALPDASTSRPGDVKDRTSSLTDASSGVFAPGSDISMDETPPRVDERGQDIPVRVYLANYGMGSPFLEDTKLCAAQSAFWPGTTPDTARVYEPFPDQPTVTPLLDSELPWDGSPQPEIVREPGKNQPGEVRHRSRAHADYITQFEYANFKLLHAIGTKEYVNRTITMARVYQSLSNALVSARSRWIVLSCKNVELTAVAADIKGVVKPIPPPPRLGGPELVTGDIVRETMKQFQEGSYRFILYRPVGARPGKEVGTALVSFFEKLTVYANPTSVFTKRDGFWEHRRF